MPIRNAPQLQGASRRALDMDVILNDVVDVNVLAKRHGVTPSYAYHAIQALGDLATVLERYSSLEDELRRLIAAGDKPDDRALADRYGFREPKFVSRESAHLRSEIAAPPKAPKTVTKPTESIRTEFEASSDDTFYKGSWADVVFARSLSGTRMPAQEYLQGLYDEGGESRQRALEFRADIRRYADGGGASRDNLKPLRGSCGFMEFKTFKHRIICRLVQVEDRSGEARRILVLLSSFSKKRDDTDAREIERADALYSAWAEGVARGGRKVKRNPEGPASFWRQVDDAESVRLATIRLMQDIQAVVREAMRRDGLGVPALADALGIDDDEAEAILWDTSMPLEDVVAVAILLGVELGAREIA